MNSQITSNIGSQQSTNYGKIGLSPKKSIIGDNISVGTSKLG